MSCMWVNFPVERTLLITIKSDDEGDLSLKSHVINVYMAVYAATRENKITGLDEIDNKVLTWQQQH